MATGGQVLLVDDDLDARRLLAILLERNQYGVLTAATAEEAITLLGKRAAQFDLVVLDLIMPGGKDGYAVCDWMREQSPAVREIPIVVLSVKSSPRDMARSFASGAFQHVTKPYDIHYLLAVVDSMIRFKRVQDEARAAAEKFGAVFENAPVGIMVVNRDHEVLEMSRALRERYPEAAPGSGVKAHEILYAPPRAEPDPDSPLTDAVERGESRRSTVPLAGSQGTVWWDMSAAPLADQQGRVTGAVLIMHDVTASREMEERLRQEVERATAAEDKARMAMKRYKDNVVRQDEMTGRLIDTQRELRRKTTQLEEANLKLEKANVLLEKLSITDDLTGLDNRRHFDELFGTETRRATRYYHPLSVIMLDIDHFKEVNDTHGHQAGDKVLKRLGDILGQYLRETDIVARYGGEEFVMVLPETTPEIAERIASRLRESIEAESFPLGDGAEIKITVSMGVVSRRGQLEADALVAAADEALYEAKRTGRNRVVMAAAG